MSRDQIVINTERLYIKWQLGKMTADEMIIDRIAVDKMANAWIQNDQFTWP